MRHVRCYYRFPEEEEEEGGGEKKSYKSNAIKVRFNGFSACARTRYLSIISHHEIDDFETFKTTESDVVLCDIHAKNECRVMHVFYYVHVIGTIFFFHSYLFATRRIKTNHTILLYTSDVYLYTSSS